MQPLLTGISNFTTTLFLLHSQFLLENNNDVNFVISPISAFVAVGMMNEGAAGITQTEISNALQVQNISELNAAANQLLSTPSQSDFNLTSSNGVFVDDDFEILESFKQTLSEMYSAEVCNIQFGSAEGEKTVNDWVNKTTKGKIEKILEETTEDDALALVNTIYMKCGWMQKFYYTKKGGFTNRFTKTVRQVDIMHVQHDFRFVDKRQLGFTAAFFPYRSTLYQNKWQMVIFNIDSRSTTNMTQVLSYMNGYQLRDMFLSGRYETLNVQLPKFKVESEIDLCPHFKTMGMKSAFEKSADFSGISQKPLTVSSIKQKSFIEVDEQGTEAAAASVIIAGSARSLGPFVKPKITDFHVRSTFAFAVFQPDTAVVLFSGVVSNPN